MTQDHDPKKPEERFPRGPIETRPDHPVMPRDSLPQPAFEREPTVTGTPTLPEPGLDKTWQLDESSEADPEELAKTMGIAQEPADKALEFSATIQYSPESMAGGAPKAKLHNESLPTQVYQSSAEAQAQMLSAPKPQPQPTPTPPPSSPSAAPPIAAQPVAEKGKSRTGLAVVIVVGLLVGVLGGGAAVVLLLWPTPEVQPQEVEVAQVAEAATEAIGAPPTVVDPPTGVDSTSAGVETASVEPAAADGAVAQEAAPDGAVAEGTVADAGLSSGNDATAQEIEGADAAAAADPADSGVAESDGSAEPSEGSLAEAPATPLSPGAAGQVEQTLRPLTEQVRRCARIEEGYFPRALTVHLQVNPSSGEATMERVTPPTPARVRGCIRRVLQGATLPGIGAEQVVYTFQIRADN